MNKTITPQDIEALRQSNTGAYFELMNQLASQATDFIFDYCNGSTIKVRTVTHSSRELSIYFTGPLYASVFCSDIKNNFEINPQRRVQACVTLDLVDTLKLIPSCRPNSNKNHDRYA